MIRKSILPFVLGGAFTLFVFTYTYAVYLDAPALTRRVVESEIERGSSAFLHCSVRAKEIPEVLNCIQAINNQNKQINMDTDAFLLGLYFRTWRAIDIRLLLAKQYMSVTNPNYILEGNDSGRLYYAEFRKRQEKMKINDEILCDLTGVNYSAVKSRLEEWGQMMKLYGM